MTGPIGSLKRTCMECLNEATVIIRSRALEEEYWFCDEHLVEWTKKMKAGVPYEVIRLME